LFYEQLADQILQTLRNYDQKQGTVSVIEASDFVSSNNLGTTAASTGPPSPTKPDSLSEDSKKISIPELIIELKSRTSSCNSL
jgi:hypothetical protein